MKSDESRNPDLVPVITVVCYVIAFSAVIGLTFWLTQTMLIEVGQQVRLIYYGYPM